MYIHIIFNIPHHQRKTYCTYLYMNRTRIKRSTHNTHSLGGDHITNGLLPFGPSWWCTLAPQRNCRRPPRWSLWWVCHDSVMSLPIWPIRYAHLGFSAPQRFAKEMRFARFVSLSFKFRKLPTSERVRCWKSSWFRTFHHFQKRPNW